MENNKIPIWESSSTACTATVEEIDHFNARGMRRVYGRSDIYSAYRTLNMDIWKNKKDQLFVRFWSRCGDVDWYSFEILGFDVVKIPTELGKFTLVDGWIPKIVRDEYNNWILEQC